MRAAVVTALLAAACQRADGTIPTEAGCSPACSVESTCQDGVCVVPAMACTTNTECRGDEHCDLTTRSCQPWNDGSDPQCHGDPVPGVFFPGVQCQWTGPPGGD